MLTNNKWISSSDKSKGSVILRKSFSITDKIKMATVYVTGDVRRATETVRWADLGHEIAEALGARPESHRNDRGYCFATAIAAAGRRHV